MIFGRMIIHVFLNFKPICTYFTFIWIMSFSGRPKIVFLTWDFYLCALRFFTLCHVF